MANPTETLATNPVAPYEAELAARLDRVPTGRFHVKLAGIISAGTFFDGFDALSIAVILSIIVNVFGINFAEAGLIVSAGYLGQFIGAIVVGGLADRIGRKNTFALCLLIFGLLSLASAFAWDAWSLGAARLIQGIGLGAEVPIAVTLMNEYLGRKNRGRFAIFFQATFSWGLFFAPLVALLLTSTLGSELGWRVLLGVGALPVVIAIWGWIALPESARWLANKGRIDEAEEAVSRVERSVTSRGKTLDEPEPPLASESNHFRISEFFRGTYGRRSITLAVLWFMTFFVQYGFSVWLPTIYVTIGKLPATSSLVLTVISGALTVVVAYVTAALVDKVGRKPLIVTGLIIAAVGGGFGAIVVGLLGQTSWPYLLTTATIAGVGIAIPACTLYLYTTELYPTRMRGFATSTASSLNRIASIISPFIVGALLPIAGGAGWIFFVFGLGTVFGLVAILVGGIETRGRRLEEVSA